MKRFYDCKKEYISDGDKSYMVIDVPVQEKLKNYQIEMLEKNKTDRLLPLSVQRMNDSWKFYYEITSRIPLHRILERKRIDKREFEQIITHLAELVRELKDYLLDIASVIFDKTLVFCDPSGPTLFFLYLPVSTGENDPDAFKRFLKNLVVDDIRLRDDESGALLKRLLEVLKYESFHFDQLLQCIKTPQKKENPVTREPEITRRNRDSCNPPVEKNPMSPLNIPGKGHHYRNPPDTNHNRVNNNTSKQADVHKAVGRFCGYALQLKYPSTSYWITGLMNLALLGLLLLFASSRNNNRGSTLMGSLLIIGAMNYFAVTRLFSKEKMIEKGEDRGLKQNTGIGKYVNNTVKKNPSSSFQPNVNPFMVGKRQHDFSRGTDIPKEQALQSGKEGGFHTNRMMYASRRMGSDKTMVLGETKEKFPYLQGRTGVNEKIKIDKDSFFIGRLHGSVDHVIDNQAIGKIHVEILKKEEQFYIVDLNSVNGTFVNGKRSASNTEILIRNGDQITLANESYVFIY